MSATPNRSGNRRRPAGSEELNDSNVEEDCDFQCSGIGYIRDKENDILAWSYI